MTRLIALFGGILLVFIATVSLLLHFIPGPHRSTDYLVIGAVATFVCLFLLWFVFARTPKKPNPPTK